MRHGPHHVAQKLSGTTFPCAASKLTVSSSIPFTAHGGAASRSRINRITTGSPCYCSCGCVSRLSPSVLKRWCLLKTTFVVSCRTPGSTRGSKTAMKKRAQICKSPVSYTLRISHSLPVPNFLSRRSAFHKMSTLTMAKSNFFALTVSFQIISRNPNK